MNKFEALIEKGVIFESEWTEFVPIRMEIFGWRQVGLAKASTAFIFLRQTINVSGKIYCPKSIPICVSAVSNEIVFLLTASQSLYAVYVEALGSHIA